MPVIIWAYPRGEAIKKKGGRDSLYAIEYAARVTAELGADVVKVNMPVLDPEKDKDAPKPYNTLRVSQEEAMERVVRAAGRTMVLVSGGSKISDADLMEKARIAMDAGATGLIFGRNVWQRPHDEALRISKEIRTLMLQYPA
jgi:class I fructose-bisphosphate aldolase